MNITVSPRSSQLATNLIIYISLGLGHPRRPRDSQSGREKRRDESFQARAKETLENFCRAFSPDPTDYTWLSENSVDMYIDRAFIILYPSDCARLC